MKTKQKIEKVRILLCPICLDYIQLEKGEYRSYYPDCLECGNIFEPTDVKVLAETSYQDLQQAIDLAKQGNPEAFKTLATKLHLSENTVITAEYLAAEYLDNLNVDEGGTETNVDDWRAPPPTPPEELTRILAEQVKLTEPSEQELADRLLAKRSRIIQSLYNESIHGDRADTTQDVWERTKLACNCTAGNIVDALLSTPIPDNMYLHLADLLDWAQRCRIKPEKPDLDTYTEKTVKELKEKYRPERNIVLGDL